MRGTIVGHDTGCPQYWWVSDGKTKIRVNQKAIQGNLAIGAQVIVNTGKSVPPLHAGATIPIVQKAPMAARAISAQLPLKTGVNTCVDGLGDVRIREAVAGMCGTPGYAGGMFTDHIFSS